MNLDWVKINRNTWVAGLGSYMIQHWYANDRGNRIPQYSAMYRGESLGKNQQPFATLKDAKCACEGHAELMAFRKERGANDN